MKVAVIGASGFVGGHVLRVLRASGDRARAVVRNPVFSSRDPDCRVADAREFYAVRDAIEGCEAIVHSIVGTPDVILGTLAPVYAAAEAEGVRRIVYMSTGSVHGQAPAPGTDERTPLSVQQLFPYNTAKVRAERRLRRLRARGTVEIVMLRPTIVFGPGSRWVADFASSLRASTACVVDGARGICNSIYVDNLAHAVRLALAVPGIDGEVFLVGDEETVTWRDLYTPIACSLGCDIDEVPSVPAPDIGLGLKHRYLEPFRSSELGQQVIRRVPRVMTRTVKRAYRVARSLSRVAQGHEAATESPGDRAEAPVVTQEMAALFSCRWRLPQDKARRVLGYHAPIPFDEGCRRSVEWLLAGSQEAAR